MAKLIRNLIIVFIVGIVVLMFATGRFSFRELQYQTRRAVNKGRVAASELTETAKFKASHENAAICRENLMLIERGKRKVADETGMTTGQVTAQQVQSALGGEIPICPSGGSYIINPLVQLPTCSLGPGSDALSKADDHSISAY